MRWKIGITAALHVVIEAGAAQVRIGDHAACRPTIRLRRRSPTECLDVLPS
jgi:hypothetical protein